MRRSAIAVLGTVLGTTLMIGAKLGHPAPDDALALDTMDQASDEEATDQVVTPAVTPTGKVARPSGTPVPGVTAKPSSPPRTSAPPQPSGFKNGTYTGPGISQKYGVIKVTIVVSGGAITSASATCTNPCSGDSRDISAKAFTGTGDKKGLYAKTITAQSASISSVSGATYTSNAYKQSLAAAINLAKA